MRFATVKNGHPDGQLVIVSHDGRQAVAATHISPHLIDAMQRWDVVCQSLQVLSETLHAGRAEGN